MEYDSCLKCYFDERDNSVIVPRIGKLHRFFHNFLMGNKYNFPLCCILRFAIDEASRDGTTYSLRSEGQAVKRGIVEKPGRYEFVPCNIFHRATNHIEWEDN